MNQKIDVQLTGVTAISLSAMSFLPAHPQDTLLSSAIAAVHTTAFLALPAQSLLAGLLLAHSISALGFTAEVRGSRALVATLSTVVHISAGASLTAIRPVAVTVSIPGLALVHTLAAVARRYRVRVGAALHSATTAVVDV